jgi:hypothetical protein
VILSDDVRVDDRLALRLVPDELWMLAEPLLPEFTPRPQGGGTSPVDQRAVFTAIVYVLSSGCAWCCATPKMPMNAALAMPMSIPANRAPASAWCRLASARCRGDARGNLGRRDDR